MNLKSKDYLLARGWKLYRLACEGKPAQWISPYSNFETYTQSEAVKNERAREATRSK